MYKNNDKERMYKNDDKKDLYLTEFDCNKSYASQTTSNVRCPICVFDLSDLRVGQILNCTCVWPSLLHPRKAAALWIDRREFLLRPLDAEVRS